ncbi:MAG: FAD/NAD(P)-binding protein [Candidatus Caenarcaniphilales bacterium]|jgi:uncharacterized NAD(P)/FAD-binding protein YdhS/quercetin dioxygenase-like cupin family protein|nr:FAD/NAD(P)-binding protein [Candidatus Caenarcaniphilales bacterium]
MGTINIDSLKEFLESNYARHLVFKTNNTEIILMCWLPGQGTEIHDHGKSDATTFVLEGEMDCTTYYANGTKEISTLGQGDIEHIPVGVKHEAHNKSSKNLVTLHIYSPPLSAEEEFKSLGYNNETLMQTIKLDENVISYLIGSDPVGCMSVFGREVRKKRNIVIIGGGFSGSLVATHLMSNPENRELQIIMIERKSKFARGFAYSTNSPMHYLNVPAAKMSAFPDHPEHFLLWAQKRDSSIQGSSFVPRMLYGEYLEAVLHEADQNKVNSISFKRFNDEAIDITINKSKEKAIIELESGSKIEADQVVLAVGNYPPRDIKTDSNSFYESELYARDPWSPKALANVSPDSDILLIGTGLTMIDKAIELNSKKHTGKIYTISRHGLIPQQHHINAGVIQVDKDLLFKASGLRELFSQIRKQIKILEKIGGDWRAYIDGLRPHTQELWKLLSEKDKKRFFKFLRPYWDTHRHRIPEKASLVIHAMINCSQLQAFAGRIKEFKQIDNHKVEVKFLNKNTKKIESLIVGKVINCTGSEQDFCQIQDPLITSLLKQKLIRPDFMSLGLDADDSGALIDDDGNISNILYTLGPPLKGKLWESTAVPEIRVQAKNLAQSLIQQNVSLKN